MIDAICAKTDDCRQRAKFDATLRPRKESSRSNFKKLKDRDKQVDDSYRAVKKHVSSDEKRIYYVRRNQSEFIENNEIM
jgi:hypothetical protein